MPSSSKKENVVISLGGSLVAPDSIDLEFLRNFRRTLQKHLEINSSLLSGFDEGKRFFIFVGGGKIARNYQKALLEFGAKETDRDWIGINVSRLNAKVIRQIFSKRAYSKIITDPTKKIIAKNSILVGAGYKPGWSTDYCSVLAAKANNIGTIVNLTNIDYVYDKDPNKFSDAKRIEEITWNDFRKLLPEKWAPGLSTPFDPRASKLAEKLKLKVIIINGKHLERLENFLDNKSFVGTMIK